jgi:hypothetical protein
MTIRSTNAAQRCTLAGALLLALLAPAAAQTTPGSDVPALLTPPPLAAPFDNLPLSPGNPLRAPSVRGALPGAPPAEVITPVPGDGKVAVDLVARFAGNGPDIPSGIKWRVFHDEVDQNGDLPLSVDSNEARPQLRLNPGRYVIHATYGLASASKHVDIQPGADPRQTQDLLLAAGALRLLAVVGDKRIEDPRKVSFKLTRSEGGVDRDLADNLSPGTTVRLPAGAYHVVSSFGDANAVVEVDLRVEPGKLLEATVHHKAASVALRLVEEAGGPPVENTQWSVLTPGGDVVRESISSTPEIVLAEGRYLAIGRHDGRSFNRTFVVRPGENQKIELLRGQASEAIPANTESGEDGGEASLD